MERSPILPEAAPAEEDSWDGKKKKKSAEKLGAILVDPKKAGTETPKTEVPKSESLWEKLLGKEQADAPKPQKPEANPTHDSVEKIAELDADEKHSVEKSLITAEGDAEAVPEDPEDAYAESHIQDFHERIVEQDQDSEAAFAETLESLRNEEPEAENEPDEADTEAALESEGEDEAEAEDAAEDETTPPLPTGGAGTGGVPPTPPNGQMGATGGSNNTPPTPPTPPMPPWVPAAATDNIPPPAPIPVPLANRPNRQAPVVVESRSNEAGAFLVGGIVGYLIGKRRGRINTEKKLISVHQRLEKQVNGLRASLAAKETAIRIAAKEQYRTRQLVRQVEEIRTPAEKPKLQNHEILPVTAAVLLESRKIGRVLVEKQTVAKPEIKPTQAKLEKPDLKVTPREVLTLKHQELLELSEKIIIEGTTLRNVYETKLVGEMGLRRIMQEYLRGGDVQKALKREIVEHEIDFNRDPKLRDNALGSSLGGSAARTQPLDSVLKEAGVHFDESHVGPLSAKKNASKPAARKSKEDKIKVTVTNHGLDITLTAAIVVLLTLVLVVAFG